LNRILKQQEESNAELIDNEEAKEDRPDVSSSSQVLVRRRNFRTRISNLSKKVHLINTLLIDRTVDFLAESQPYKFLNQQLSLSQRLEFSYTIAQVLVEDIAFGYATEVKSYLHTQAVNVKQDIGKYFIVVIP